MLTMISETNATITNGPTLHVAKVNGGSQSPLVLIHDLGRNWRDWATAMPIFASRRPCAALDMPGHGESGRSRERIYSVAEYASPIVTRILKGFIAPPGVVYAKGLSAAIALAIAAEAPALVRAVIIEAPRLEASKAVRQEFAALQAFAERFEGIREARRSAIAYSYREVAEQAFARTQLERGEASTAPPAAVVEMQRNRQAPPAPETFEAILAAMVQQQAALPIDRSDGAAVRFLARCLDAVDPEALAAVAQGRYLQGFNLKAALQAINQPVLALHEERDEAVPRLMKSLRNAYTAKIDAASLDRFQAVSEFLESL